jgi:hypothetical protein
MYKKIKKLIKKLIKIKITIINSNIIKNTPKILRTNTKNIFLIKKK